MADVRRRHTAEPIVGEIRRAGVGLARGQSNLSVVGKLGIMDRSYHCWHKD